MGHTRSLQVLSLVKGERFPYFSPWHGEDGAMTLGVQEERNNKISLMAYSSKDLSSGDSDLK